MTTKTQGLRMHTSIIIRIPVSGIIQITVRACVALRSKAELLSTVAIDDNGGITMLGRSDGVLNPQGVRFGSAELYAVVEEMKDE